MGRNDTTKIQSSCLIAEENLVPMEVLMEGLGVGSSS